MNPEAETGAFLIPAQGMCGHLGKGMRDSDMVSPDLCSLPSSSPSFKLSPDHSEGKRTWTELPATVLNFALMGAWQGLMGNDLNLSL